MATSGFCTRAPGAITVLFVDDDADSRFAYELIATEAGMAVELARDGHEAISLAEILLPDVIVLDVGLSDSEGLDGFEVARRLHASVRTSAIPIIFLSGYDGERDVAAMLAVGCEGHLTKPCTAEVLLGLVTELARSRGDKASGGDALTGAA